MHNKAGCFETEIFQANNFKQDTLKLYEDILNRDSSLRIRVTGRSMSPFLKSGEILHIKKVPSASLHTGDLIFYKNPDNTPVIHRIIRKNHKNNKTIFQTKGDALFMPDKYITGDAVLGKVFKIENPSFFPWVKHINMESFCWKKVNFSIAMLGMIRTKLRSAVLKFL